MHSFSQGNHQFITHYQGEKTLDINRVVDIGAKAIGRARYALDCLPQDMPMTELFSDPEPLSRYCASVAERTILDDEFSNIVAELLAVMVILPGDHLLAQRQERFHLAINDAVGLSDRFLDLMAAEKARMTHLVHSCPADTSNTPHR